MTTASVHGERIHHHFLGWQCRLRQHAIRHLNGRPTRGLRPDVTAGDSDTGYEGVTVLLVRKESARITREFRHMVLRTKDPRQRYDSALKFMSESYYQHPLKFSEGMTALFGPGSNAATTLVTKGNATLFFAEKNQTYKIPCGVRLLDEKSDDWQATFWHNHLFTPALPGDVQIVQFVPDWARAEADPAVY